MVEKHDIVALQFVDLFAQRRVGPMALGDDVVSRSVQIAIRRHDPQVMSSFADGRSKRDAAFEDVRERRRSHIWQEHRCVCLHIAVDQEDALATLCQCMGKVCRQSRFNNPPPFGSGC